MSYIVRYWCLLAIVFSACAKESCNVVPNVNVYQSFSQGSTGGGFGVGQAITLSGGAAGIIVYRAGQNEYNAYDRCSTVNPEQRNQVEIKDDVTLLDPKSGAEWLLLDGSPTKIATCPLRPYRVTSSGNIYYVQN